MFKVNLDCVYFDSEFQDALQEMNITFTIVKQIGDPFCECNVDFFGAKEDLETLVTDFFGELEDYDIEEVI